MKYLYLFLDLGSLAVPLLVSFHPRIRFTRSWHGAFPALLITAFVFVLWDMAYTQMGVWGFNESYLSGYDVGNLPLEEVLFFLCIPYACLFTYHCLNLLPGNSFFERFESRITIFLLLLCLAAGFTHLTAWYTAAACLLCAALLLLFRYLLRVNWLARFYRAFVVLLIPFFVVNGVLTGTGPDAPVVWYNDAENMGLRVLTIPVEDFFYSMCLLLINTALMEWLLQRRSASLS